MNFDGNYCTSAMTSFNTVGYLQDCPGVVSPGVVSPGVVPIENPCSTLQNQPTGRIVEKARATAVPTSDYPELDGGHLQQATSAFGRMRRPPT